MGPRVYDTKDSCLPRPAAPRQHKGPSHPINTVRGALELVERGDVDGLHVVLHGLDLLNHVVDRHLRVWWRSVGLGVGQSIGIGGMDAYGWIDRLADASESIPSHNQPILTQSKKQKKQHTSSSNTTMEMTSLKMPKATGTLL